MKTSPRVVLSPRKCPRQARSAVTVDAIFEATLQVLLATGSTRLNTTKVAERAGVSVGTLYQYFPNKQSLLFAVLERYLDRLMDRLEAACEARRGGAAEDMIEGVVQAYLQVKAEEAAISRALYYIVIELDARELVDKAIWRAERAIAAMLSTANDGQFSDPQAIARVVFAAIHGTVRMFYERDLPPMAGGDVERQLTMMCRSYVAAAGRTP
ncbi:TetR/AcrR family transcriptional regulator [Phyllobacterium phragmitis]|uniref:HTH tetR-type domain-containing protein n=1 Tax=Phyllobacterium phragmitis TaxID=2670329 RepID=A0ABQ0H329_9HYPH